MKNELEIKLDNKAQEVIGEVAKEHGGGGATYTGGNGITITDENVINADTKVVVYNGDLTRISRNILATLNVGDILDVYHYYYYVSYKTDMDLRITRVDQNMVMTYFYSKNGAYYKYTHLEERSFPPYAGSVYLSPDEGDIDYERYDNIEFLGYCLTDYGMAISIGWDDEEDTIKLATTVQDNRYYTISFTYNEPESEEEDGTYSYVITEHTLSIGGIEFVPIDIEATSIDQETLEKLVDFDNNSLKPNFIILGTDKETDTFPILMPSDGLQNIYRSAVMGNKYYQLTLQINELGADVSIRQISLGGGGGIDNLCDYYPRLAAINGKQMFSDNSYYLDVDALIQYVEDSGVGDIPFEPNLEDTYPRGIELISNYSGDIGSGLGVFLQSQTSNSNSYLFIDFAGNMVNVDDLINNEGDTLAVFLTRNKDAIKEVVNGTSFSGFNIRNMLDGITDNEMCICRAWVNSNTNVTYAHSMNLIKFLELFHAAPIA